MKTHRPVNLATRVRGLAVAALGAAVIAAGSCGDSPTAPSPPPSTCSYQLTSGTESLGPEGGAATVTVSTGAQCTWTARVDADWLTITSGASGTGPGTVNVTAAANEQAASREVRVTVADQSLRLMQRGRAPCEFTVTPDDLRVGAAGGAGTIEITTAAGCAWTAATDKAWLTLTPASGSGSAQVGYKIASHDGDTARVARITIADRVVNVRQDPRSRECEYAASPAEFNQHWHNDQGVVEIVTQAGCRWTVRSTASWLTFEGGANRQGPGTVQFRHGTLTEERTRKAALELRWSAPSAGQNTWVNQEGCYYGLGERAKEIPREGGRYSVTVIGTPMSTNCMTGCPWTATSSASWLRLSTKSGAGDDMMFYDVDPNPGPAARTGVITVKGHTLVITQTF